MSHHDAPSHVGYDWPCCPDSPFQYLPLSHSVAVLATRLTAVTLQCLCACNPYFKLCSQSTIVMILATWTCQRDVLKRFL